MQPYLSIHPQVSRTPFLPFPTYTLNQTGRLQFNFTRTFSVAGALCLRGSRPLSFLRPHPHRFPSPVAEGGCGRQPGKRQQHRGGNGRIWGGKNDGPLLLEESVALLRSSEEASGSGEERQPGFNVTPGPPLPPPPSPHILHIQARTHAHNPRNNTRASHHSAVV